MDNELNLQNDLTQVETAELIIDYFHRIIMHHALWFSEVCHQIGQEEAYKILDSALKQSYDIQMKRLSKVIGFEMIDGLPSALSGMSKEKLDAVKDSVAANWLANDGVWFQAVENSFGMFDAKRCNDSCWAQFSPFEAWSVKRYLKLNEYPGLVGLKEALQFRLYATINKQEIIEETNNSFVFRMVDCRVQSARKRKELPDYPCKSAGIVEYRSFASAIDKRIRTECIGCPPDIHPENYYCSWKFSIDESN